MSSRKIVAAVLIPTAALLAYAVGCYVYFSHVN